VSHSRIGAGEGNRTLVISLEGFRSARIFKGFSDKSPASATLYHKVNSPLSERGVRMSIAPIETV
jgi:hypothetical protein